MTNTTDPFSFSARVSGSGDCRIPNVFGEQYRRLSAGLDWARVFSGKVDHRSTAVELEAAADAAENLARQCREYAQRAREQAR